MDLTHVHLFLNHIPIVGSVMVLVFLGYALFTKKSDQIKMSFWFLFIIAVILIPVYLTGEPAELAIEKPLGLPEEIIDRHEEAALISLVIVELIGAVSLIGLYINRKMKTIPLWFSIMMFILSLIMVISFARTATFGGEIRHSEIRAEKVIDK